MKEIGDTIRDLRKLKGVSQRELAERSGLSIATIQGYEQKKYKPGTDAILKLSVGLDVPILDLLSPGQTLRFGDGYFLAEEPTDPRDKLIYDDTVLSYKLNCNGIKKSIEYKKDLIDSGKYRADTKHKEDDHIQETET